MFIHFRKLRGKNCEQKLWGFQVVHVLYWTHNILWVNFQVFKIYKPLKLCNSFSYWKIYYSFLRQVIINFFKFTFYYFFLLLIKYFIVFMTYEITLKNVWSNEKTRKNQSLWRFLKTEAVLTDMFPCRNKIESKKKLFSSFVRRITKLFIDQLCDKWCNCIDSVHVIERRCFFIYQSRIDVKNILSHSNVFFRPFFNHFLFQLQLFIDSNSETHLQHKKILKLKQKI